MVENASAISVEYGDTTIDKCVKRETTSCPLKRNGDGPTIPCMEFTWTHQQRASKVHVGEWSQQNGNFRRYDCHYVPNNRFQMTKIKMQS